MVGSLTSWCLTECITRGIDSQRVLVTEPGEKVSLPPPGMAACGQLKIARCAVYKKGCDRDQELLTCQVLAGHAEDTGGDRVRGQLIWRDGNPSLPFSSQGLCVSSISSYLFLCTPLFYYINALIL